MTKNKPIEFIDVGSNEGQSIKDAISFLSNLKIINCFEPFDNKKLENTIKIARSKNLEVNFYNQAVGVGNYDFNITNTSD